MQKPKEVAQLSRAGRVTRMALAILLSSCSGGSQRRGSGLEGLHQVLLKLPRCFVEKFAELICAFSFSLQEKFCMETSLYQITDDARPTFFVPEVFYFVLDFDFSFCSSLSYHPLLDSFLLPNKIFSYQFLHEERSWRG